MKKWIRIYTISIMIFVFFATISMPILNVQATNINYEISYSTQIIGSTQIKCEGDLNPKRLTGYNETFRVDITDSTIVTAIEKYKREALKQINETTPNAMVSDRTFTDAFEYPIPPENVKHYFRFFELPTNFNGTKVIVKDDVPFKVTGDGKGNLSMTIVSDFIGSKQKTFIIPEEKTHTIKEEMFSQNYHVSYRVPNSATEFMPNDRFGSYNAKTLEEALQYCAQNADLNQTISIYVTQTYRVDINATASRKVYLNVAYGNSFKNSSNNSSGNAKQESSATQDTSSENKNSLNETTVISPPNVEQEHKGELVENGVQTQTEEIQESNDVTVKSADSKKDNNKDVNKDKKTSLKRVIVFCIVSVLVFGGLSVLIIKKIMMKKRQ